RTETPRFPTTGFVVGSARMGRLVNLRSGSAWQLTSEQIVGRRAADGSMTLTSVHVSTQHADIRWNNGTWCLKDLGSLNGTFVNGERLAPAEWRELRRGDVLCFGDPSSDAWELVDPSAPGPVVVALDGSPPQHIEQGIVGIPVGAAEATLWRDDAGGWWLEPVDRPAVSLEHGAVFEVAGKRYRLDCDDPVPTVQLTNRTYERDKGRLVIRHSRDEEHVEALVQFPHTTLKLDERQHLFLLLVLARERISDRVDGTPETSCGWIDIELLMQRLKMDRPALNTHVFRVRKQFEEAGFRDAMSVIERRVQTRQLRVGFKELAVEAL
ncbi:MAG TPA: FHA domain-containing protein, partial [Polyangiales bacterium]|nr:FHA domain-containing protein [Polyangiales bacterium]